MKANSETEKVPHYLRPEAYLSRVGEGETRKTRDKLKENSQTRRYIKRHTSNFSKMHRAAPRVGSRELGTGW